MHSIISGIVDCAWLIIFAIDIAYEAMPRRTRGTGPLSKWLRVRYLQKWLVFGPLGILQFAVAMPLIAVGHGRASSLVCYIVFWLPLGAFDIIDWLGEKDRYRRFKRGASEKIKQLLARLKPAPVRPVPFPA